MNYVSLYRRHCMNIFMKPIKKSLFSFFYAIVFIFTLTATPQFVVYGNVQHYNPAWQQIQELLEFEFRVFELTNIERVRYGLNPVAWSNDLAGISRMHSSDMATNDFFSHTGSDGASPGGRVWYAGIALSRVGENIAAGAITPELTVAAWMMSPGHKAVILNENFRYMGVGMYVFENSSWVFYITQKFGW